jgi:hypothetical protein
MKTRKYLPALLGAIMLALCASASAQTFSGSITLSDPTENGRLFRDGVPSVAGMMKPFPGISGLGTPFHYDAYTFTNPFAVSTAFTITLTTNTVGVFPFSVVYLGSFDPNNIATNYQADGGFSADAGAPSVYSFDIPAGATFVAIVNEVTSGVGVADYSFSLTPSTVPEPSTVVELFAGAALLGLFAWRRHSRAARLN